MKELPSDLVRRLAEERMADDLLFSSPSESLPAEDPMKAVILGCAACNDSPIGICQQHFG